MSKEKSSAWWKEPMMWLVVGGPALVVIAGLSTVWIAVHSADEVLPHGAVQPKNATELPAMQGRNHVAAPQKVLN